MLSSTSVNMIARHRRGGHSAPWPWRHRTGIRSVDVGGLRPTARRPPPVTAYSTVMAPKSNNVATECAASPGCWRRMRMRRTLSCSKALPARLRPSYSTMAGFRSAWAPRNSTLPKVPFVADQPKTHYELEACGRTHQVSVLSMGNPHCVLLVDSIASADVDRLGPAIEEHRAFSRTPRTSGS